MADFMIIGSDGGVWHLTVLIVPREDISGKMEVDQCYKGHQFVPQEKDNGATAREDGESFIVNNLLGESAAKYPSSGNRFILSTAKTVGAVKYSANETSSWMLNDKNGTTRVFA